MDRGVRMDRGEGWIEERDGSRWRDGSRMGMDRGLRDGSRVDGWMHEWDGWI